MDDLIRREDAIKAVEQEYKIDRGYMVDVYTYGFNQAIQYVSDIILQDLPSAAAEWIPFTRRPMTKEEQEYYPDCTFMFDCVLPDDGDEILVSNGRFVWMDTFCNDDGCYLDGGDDIDEDMAWMPLPKPYKAESEEV